ncbi:orotidine-5'-phosphate decarboxylase [Blastochloris viridis]|uniref:Orotidine 5'-phosphate decarboxylase n=1 Tax=Blastochloris viridis TaxID=1079 RepID=A0A0H5BAX1_BLAVI|nr:orotidine-5'-phosphate decarboxylase [Blastochloris viridis]ALK10696.1 Orotidine 5'-phosphate decarboxylase [Blastochloris viridis]BAR99340.1 orotidine 5'-phosphate decarboxylase [Blastochloris viridis]CUU43359.1 Orotidine 5'-phosphate decarboxylase [Blastochloris viridis]
MIVPARERLIVALDVPSVAEAEHLVETLAESAVFYKIGLELAIAGGIDFAGELIAAGYQVFLDLKLHDIANTVERATRKAAELGVSFLTVHAYPQTMRAAVAGRGDSELKILGVSVLTSWDQSDLAAAGVEASVAATVARRAAQAKEAGVDGLVCSAEEVAAVRAVVGRDMALVTPGIRPTGSAVGDQKRVMGPGAAIRAGADFLVVGRPIIAAPDPKRAADLIVGEIAAAAAI